MTRPWSIEPALAENRYPGKRVPDRVLVCQLTRAERRAVYKTLDLIQTPGSLHRAGTPSRATALAWLANEAQWRKMPELAEKDDCLKAARFWLYSIDVVLLEEQMSRSSGNLARIAASLPNGFGGVGGLETQSFPAGGQPLTTGGKGFLESQHPGVCLIS